MRVLVIGSGGREHALLLGLSRDPSVTELHVAPGNAGTASIATNHAVDVVSADGVVALARQLDADLVVIGPEVPLVLGVADVLRDAPDAALDYPAVMHCKSGADRAGLAATLYLILHEGRPVREAVGQLSARYGHFRFAKTGILDAFFALYRREGEPKGLDFLTWVETEYDPEALKRSFRPGFWSDLVVDRIIKRE